MILEPSKFLSPRPVFTSASMLAQHLRAIAFIPSASCHAPLPALQRRAWIPTLIPTTVFSRFLFIKIRQKPNTDGEKEPHLTGGLDSPVTGVCECRSDVGVAESSLWRCGSGLGQQEAQRGDG